ncbi:MAG: AarF/UbiB family protein [Syntrophaceticus sp.]|nr:AarF/UbiB family protein [Syntrophaceticus sp.]MDD3315186.1 AarF/UbiB family protein [Syntrophaceticus sp.]MDD4359227.1 AarF/UbiB family protein [Syntrophaceticus sp.]MDD4783389.1 AarF/UbiB family protein [Syntrophaceticus sp.]
MAGRTKGFAYRYRHVRRYQEILNILAKNGFGFIIDRLELPGQSLYQRFKKGKPPQEEELANLPKRITWVMKELGPTFIKLGQLLSTRPDLLPADYIKEFAKLQDEVTPVPIEQIESTVWEETGSQVSVLFAEFESEALASASIGQVHRAKLFTGEDVVVKIQRTGIERLIKTDLEILEDIAKFLEERTPLVENYNITDMLVEFRISILEELDFSLEGRNAEIFKTNLQDDSRVYIPEVYWEYTKQRVLVMEYVEGKKISGREKMIAAGYDPRQIAEALVEAMITQIYTDGFFHSDPHPGNLAVLPENKIVFMDFGQVGYLDEEIREKAADMVLALLKHDIDAVVKGLLQIGIVRGQPNMSHLRRDVSRLERKYYGMSLQEIEVGTSIQELMEVASRYNIRVPTDFVMAAKAGVTLEGTIRDLVPDLSLVEIGRPFAAKVYLHRYDPRKIIHKTQQNSFRLFSTLMHLPELLEDLIDNIRSGRLALSIELKDLPMAINQLKSTVNRLAISIIFSSLLIAGALMVCINPSSFIIRYHISEIVFIFAVLLVGLLLFTIFFDRRN